MLHLVQPIDPWLAFYIKMVWVTVRPAYWQLIPGHRIRILKFWNLENWRTWKRTLEQGRELRSRSMLFFPVLQTNVHLHEWYQCLGHCSLVHQHIYASVRKRDYEECARMFPTNTGIKTNNFKNPLVFLTFTALHFLYDHKYYIAAILQQVDTFNIQKDIQHSKGHSKGLPNSTFSMTT
jgi:hypothetical protein